MAKTRTYTISQNGEEVMSITITQPDDVVYQNIQWDSKTGMVSAEIDGKRKPIPFTGKSCGKLMPAGFVAEGFRNIQFNYWYY